MERWDRIGRGAAYGAALALSPYLLIKVSWVVGSLLGVAPVGEGFSLPGWMLFNTVTIGMAGLGIALALAMVRPWGMRIPGRLVAFCAWTGSGFLVSILPYAVLSTLLDAAGGDPPDDTGSAGSAGDTAVMPGWEANLIQLSFIATGVGLAAALPAHLRRRWPEAFAGRPAGAPRPGVPWAAAVAAAVGLAWLYWTAGGTLGLAHPSARDTDARLLTGVSATWALAGAAALYALTRPRPTRTPHRLLLALAWLGSGSLFAWSAWKLPLTVYVALAHPPDVTPPEHPAAATALHLAAVTAGAGMLRALVTTRRHAPASRRPAALGRPHP